MKSTVILVSILLFLIISYKALSQTSIIIDHNCTDLSVIPDGWVIKAKNDFRIAYGHTSHGSQIITGMERTISKFGNLYNYNSGEGSLDLSDRTPSGDLGNPDRTEWANKTRALLNDPKNDRNMIMWSWCGQASTAKDTDINTYLTLMTELENDFPEITFVYMTGHLDGSGEQGNLNLRNNQIREYCKKNKKILFDFADIESYDPDGNYYLDKKANDACAYDGGNWAVEWCNAHPGECDDCGCAHSHCLNCQQKGKAFWWMMAEIAGWTPLTSIKKEFENNKSLVSPNPFSQSTIINFELSVPDFVSILVYDIYGNEMVKLVNHILESGKHAIEFNSRGFAQGLYYYRIKKGKEIENGKMIITK